MALKKSKGLGRGLDVLLGADLSINDISLKEKKTSLQVYPTVLALSKLRTGKYQPRTHMDEEALRELAQSIRMQGVMQPILVRALKSEPDYYEIIAGERRFRAAQLAGLKEVPILVREVADENAAIMALIENIQREDLNPLEEAQGVRRLLDEFELTHEQAAQAIGRSRSATSNLLRLLNLAVPVQNMLSAGNIDMGHARALLAVEAADQIQLANLIKLKRLSVREAEKLVTRSTLNVSLTQAKKKKTGVTRDLTRLEQALSEHLATKVSLKITAKERGQIVIDFHGWEHLNALLERQGLSGILDV